MPGAHLVDLIPICKCEAPLVHFRFFTHDVSRKLEVKYLPKWFPFTRFHKVGDYGRRIVLDFVNRPFAYVQRAMVSSI